MIRWIVWRFIARSSPAAQHSPNRIGTVVGHRQTSRRLQRLRSLHNQLRERAHKVNCRCRQIQLVILTTDQRFEHNKGETDLVIPFVVAKHEVSG